MFKLQSPSKYSPFHDVHLLRHFFPLLKKQFLNLWILMPFSASDLFGFTSSTSAKTFPLRTFFILGNKQSHMGQDPVNREGGAWGGHAVFLASNCWTLSTVWAGARAYKSLIMKWSNTLKESSKKLTEAETQPLTTTPAGALIWMGPWNTHQVGEACSTRGPLWGIRFWFWGDPLVSQSYVLLVIV